ncbi:MAG TPA: right-handed parallel beta-helix repeat-containing protein, partial [Candidatus Dormibacteraeota bacterium]|nr:right-handed parallel beta-helix repeat-containing protein [Candidatus Dormibacteraeota bacterium]
MRLELLRGRHSSALSPSLLLQHAWKLGVSVLMLGVVAMARSSAPPFLHSSPRAVTANSIPTTVQCGTIPVDSSQTVVWNASGSPYILPWNDPKIPPTDPTRQPNCLTKDSKGNTIGDDVHLAPGTKLIIDGSLGPVQIFSHGAGITVDGGEIKTIFTDKTNFVSFDAEPDVASWDGVAIHASDPTHVGDASFSFVSIQHALTAISIDSGANASPDSANYGLTVANSGIGPSYFDGIDARDTPISVTGLGDGQYGTVNNIGSQGINVTFDNAPAINEDALKVTGITFGSSVPFGETGCPPEPLACANRVLGFIGNNAVLATVLPSTAKPVVIDQNKFFRAGSFGIDLLNANHPQITNNGFVCNGSGSPSPVTTCVANGTLQRFSAIYLDNVTADLPDTTTTPPTSPATSGVSNNVGQENGLDAIVLSGRVTSNVTWMTPTNDPNGPEINGPHYLGYMVANVAGTGGLEILGQTLSVDGANDVVKVQGGGITLTGGLLKAESAGRKTFTSMRDNSIGIQACPSVFVQTCLTTLPSNEWVGLDLAGAAAQINNAYILYPTKGVYATNAPPRFQAPDTTSYGLVLTGSTIGPSFSDGIATSGMDAYIAGNRLCRIDESPKNPDGSPNPNYLACVGAGPGDHGINLDSSGGAHKLRLLNNTIQGSANEGILGTGLGSATIDVESNAVDKAGAYGVRLAGAQNPTIATNVITRSGTGATTYSAMLLTGLSNANFQKSPAPAPTSIPACTCIDWNSGYGNGLDAIAFDGSTGPLNWKSPANVNASAPLGYLLDDSLQVNGALTLNAQDVVEIVRGKITVSNGALSASNALVSSIKQGADNLPAGFGAVNLPTCGSIFDPLTSGICPKPAPGDWGGLVLDGQRLNTFTGSTIRFAGIGIEVDKPANQPLSLAQTSIQEVADTAIHSESYLVVNGAQLSNTARSTGNGIWFDSGASISGTQISNSGQEGIVGTSLNTAASPVVITGTSINGAGTYGIRLMPAGQALAGGGLTITNNDVSNSGTGASPYPAIYLGGVSAGVVLYPGEVAAPASAVSIQGNSGKGNG